MKIKKTIDGYRIVVAWSDDDECFVARVPAFVGVAAHGDSAEAAVAEARIALGAVLAVLEEDGIEAPESDQTLEQVRAMLPLINISKLARLAKINRQTLSSKLERGTVFSREESRRIHRALDAVLA